SQLDLQPAGELVEDVVRAASNVCLGIDVDERQRIPALDEERGKIRLQIEGARGSVLPETGGEDASDIGESSFPRSAVSPFRVVQADLDAGGSQAEPGRPRFSLPCCPTKAATATRDER